MGKLYLVNAFSLNMLPPRAPGVFPGYQYNFLRITPENALKAWNGVYEGIVERIAAIGHADTAKIVSGILGVEIPPARVTVTLGEGDGCLVAQYTGPRLPEGATVLPSGAEIVWWWVMPPPPAKAPRAC